MTPEIDEIPNAVYTRPEVDFPDGSPVRGSAACKGLFQRQLLAAGLEASAEKISAGRLLNLDDALVLARAGLPLLARIVQMCGARSTGFSRLKCRQVGPGGKASDTIPPGGGTTSATLPIERIGAATALPRHIAQPLTDRETLCRELLALRDDLAATGETAAWYPQIARPPDENGPSADNFTGVEVLRAIALARLLLPASVQIIAPLATLGPKLAQVALEFGATHIGYLAADGQLPAGPLLADPDVLEELQGSCMPTVLKEDL